MSNQDQTSTRLGTMVFTIANELVNHYGKKLDREVIDEITRNLSLEMCQGPTAWAFSDKDQPGTCQQPQPNVVMAVEFDRVTAERDALQQRLNAADQRIDEMTSERENLIAYGRSNGLDEAATLCTRMAHDAYFPAGTRFKHFTPKAQAQLGNLLIKAANAIADLPDGPYARHCARQQQKAAKSATA